MRLILLLFILCFHKSGAVIYSLNKSEYARMPPLYHLDAYEHCLYENDASGVYCYAHFDLVAEEPSDLMHIIQEYSAREETHFNHSRLTYGICLTKTCKDFYINNTTGNRKAILEACLNETLWRDYKLKAKIIDKHFSCTTARGEYKIDMVDGIAAILLLSLLGLNLVECLREIYYGTDKCPQGNNFLACFSISQNWARLTSHSVGPDPRLTKLTFLRGFRCIITIPVLIAHTLIKYFITGNDSSEVEMLYRRPLTQLLIQGGLTMQIFFVVAGFLLAYNFEIIAAKKKISASWIPMAIGHRWLKLFPPFAVVVAFYATWFKHLGSGPLWQAVVVNEAQICCTDWWKNLLFINNYIDDKPGQVGCIVSSWYLASDFQLHTLGVLVLVLTSGLRRKILLGVLIFTGLIVVGAHTYFQDLNGNLFFNAEFIRNSLINDLSDPTYNIVYRRAHTNVAAYMVGIASGLAAFHLSKSGYKLDKYSFMRHRYTGLLYVVVLEPFLVYNYVFMYPDGPRPSLLLRTAYAVLTKAVLLALTAFFLISMVLLENDTGRGIMSWQGWTVPSRVAMSAYLVHFAIIKIMTGSLTSLLTAKFAHGLLDVCGTLCFIYAGAILFHL